MTNLEIIKSFFGDWDKGRMVPAIDELFTEDAVWRNSGFPACEGKAACVALAAQYIPTLPVVDVELLAAAENGDTVFTQRIDHCKNPEGVVTVDAQVCGVFKLRDGKICYWYDYFDPAEFPAEAANLSTHS